MTTPSIGLLAGASTTFALIAIPHAQRPSDSILAQTPAALAAPVDPRVAKLKALVDADVSSPAMYDLGQQMNDMLFSFGEIGFQEVETQRYFGKLVSVEYTFKRETAHSASAPWRGRSALDAVELMNAGSNYRREHRRLSQRTHYVITNGGDGRAPQ